MEELTEKPVSVTPVMFTHKEVMLWHRDAELAGAASQQQVIVISTIFQISSL